MKKRAIYGVLLAFLVGGCSTATSPIVEYKLTPEYNIELFKVEGCKENSLKIAKVFTQKSLESSDMNYMIGKNKQYKFTQSIWTQSLDKAVGDELLNYLRGAKIFKSVQLFKSRSKSEYLLETNVETFIQHFSEDEKKSYVEVVITLTLLDVKKDTLIDSHSFSSKVESNSIDAEGGVDALGIALGNVLTQSGSWLSGVCR